MLQKGKDSMAKKLVSAGVVSVLPIIHNALNPSDTRYGKKKGVEDFKPEKTDPACRRGLL